MKDNKSRLDSDADSDIINRNKDNLTFDSSQKYTFDDKEIVTLESKDYSINEGYDPNFLTKTVPFPTLNEKMRQDSVSLIDDKNSNELKYNHFSIVMSKTRKLAIYTAVNIDGKQLRSIKRSNDRWYFDPRIEKEFQIGPKLYFNNDLDRGHLVKREDPIWGDEDTAYKANEDTFHFTNCAPQHKDFNQKTWVDLENYIIKNAKNNSLKVSIFTGPIFRDDDLVYRENFKIPKDFWKVAVMLKDNGELSATSYLQTQQNLINDLEFVYDEYKTYQVRITEIEAATKLDFGTLRDKDPMSAIETLPVRQIKAQSDIVL
jgi:endonuclease G